MVAWFLRAVIALFVCAAAAWATVLMQRGRPGLGIAGALAILCAHVPILALEFALLRVANRGDPEMQPAWGEVVKAWWGEVLLSSLVFLWRQPFRASAVPDHLERGARGVVLIHGFVCNRGMWNDWLERFRRLGVPCIAVNLEPVFGSIESYAPTIERAVRRIEALSAGKPVVVGHSMGGLAVRSWLRTQPADRIHRVFTIGTPHRGTWLATFALTRNARQMRSMSAWIGSLDSKADDRFTCFYSRCDNVVQPARSATLQAADNRHVACTGHIALVFEDEVFEAVAAVAGPASRSASARTSA